jgi:osmotically-inducible protein OsmY
MRNTRNYPGVVFAALLFALPAFGAAGPPAVDITPQFANAGLSVSGLRAVEIGGIVLLRGTTDDPANAAAASAVAQSLGYARVANLIRVVDDPNDEQIERTAERKLATRTLDGCSFHVDSNRGVLTVDGTVQYELQKDLALSLVRNIRGVREVRSAISR